MVRPPLHWLLPASFLFGACAAFAQAEASAAKPDPLNAQASVPAQIHTSTFAAYRRAAEAVPIGWKEANDTVTRIGGWRAYTREAAQPSPTAPAGPASGGKP